MIFVNLLRFFGALSLSVVFGFFSFFIVQVLWSLGGGSMGWWPKLLVDIAWFYTPAFLGSLAIVSITWIYSDIKGKKLALAILFVYLCSFIGSYLGFNITLNKYLAIEYYWLRYGMVREMAFVSAWAGILGANIGSIFLWYLYVILDNINARRTTN
tara:strand:+ start:55 stop:522 length:468 start_codon:yes stop_codon:yes gene_type:complete